MSTLSIAWPCSYVRREPVQNYRPLKSDTIGLGLFSLLVNQNSPLHLLSSEDLKLQTKVRIEKAYIVHLLCRIQALDASQDFIKEDRSFGYVVAEKALKNFLGRSYWRRNTQKMNTKSLLPPLNKYHFKGPAKPQNFHSKRSVRNSGALFIVICPEWISKWNSEIHNVICDVYDLRAYQCITSPLKIEGKAWRGVYQVNRDRKKRKTGSLIGKIMATDFWDCRGILLILYVPKGTTIITYN